LPKFAGRRVLVLGSNVGAPELVKYARHNGAYVVVADYLPVDRSPAKPLADSAVMISTADIDGLLRLVAEKKINAVASGISEFNLVQAMEIAESCGFPFYCSRAQWDAVGKKDRFRALCEQHEVACPKTWFVGKEPSPEVLESMTYPMIVKPVDSSSSIGVTICSSAAELPQAISVARKESGSGKIIIESFIEGQEFTVHYTISEGKARISTMDNRYGVHLHAGTVTSIPVARTYPSTFLTEFLAQVDPGMVRLCENLGVDNGVVFAQGIYDADLDRFAVFEGGLRPAGEATWRLAERANGINPWQLVIDRCLLGEASYDIEKEDPWLGGKVGAVLSLVGRGGRVGAISGLSQAVREATSVFDWESRYPVGSVVPDGDSLRQLMIRFAMLSDTAEVLVEDIKRINNLVRVLDDSGQDMCLRFDIDRFEYEKMPHHALEAMEADGNGR